MGVVPQVTSGFRPFAAQGRVGSSSYNDPLNRVDPLGLRSSDCDANGPSCTYIVNDLPYGRVGGPNGGYIDALDYTREFLRQHPGDERLGATLTWANEIAGYSQEAGVNTFMLFAVSMNEIGGHDWHGVDTSQWPACMAEGPKGAKTRGITNVSLAAFGHAAEMSPQLLESGGSVEDNWENLTCNSRYSIRATSYYLKYIEYKFNQEIASKPGFYRIVTESAYANGPLSNDLKGYERDGGWHRLLSKSALLSLGYTRGVDDPPMMQLVMAGGAGDPGAFASGYGGPNGGGGAFNTKDLMPLAHQFYCGGSVYSC